MLLWSVEMTTDTESQGGNVDEAEKAFLKGAVERGITGLKGHRSVGGKHALMLYPTGTRY